MNTAQDIVAFLLAANGGGAQDGEHLAVRQAVIHGTREVMQCRNWLWHTYTGSFTTKPFETTGTAVQDSYEVLNVADTSEFFPGRLVEADTGVFPAGVRVDRVDGNLVYMNQPALATAQTTLRPQVFYNLPADLKDIDTLVTNTVGTLHCYITPQEWQRLEINTRGAGEPYYYTIMRSDSDPNRWQVRFVGLPPNETVVHYTYRRTPKQVKYMGYERITRQGDVTVTAQGLVTGNDTAFPSDVEGSVIRFGSLGMDAEAQGATVPYVAEYYIDNWNSATSIVIANPTQAFPANTKYAISDEIDCSPQMWTAVLSACEMWYARLAGKPADAAMAAFNRDLRIAMENDTIAPRSGRPYDTPYPTPRSMGWHSELLPDVG